MMRRETLNTCFGAGERQLVDYIIHEYDGGSMLKVVGNDLLMEYLANYRERNFLKALVTLLYWNYGNSFVLEIYNDVISSGAKSCEGNCIYFYNRRGAQMFFDIIKEQSDENFESRILDRLTDE